jgi:phosphomethylpyrimidine synthase
MNAPDKLQQLLALTREPFPQSRKVYVPGTLDGVRVPMREIVLSNGERITVHDTSGPYTDPEATVDVRRGLPALRGEWSAARGDTEPYPGRQHQAVDDGGKAVDERLQALREQAAGLQRTPRRARAGAHVTQMHYARRGIVTPEMEFVAIRENGRREWMREYLGDAEREARLRGHPLGAQIPEVITPELGMVDVGRDHGAAARHLVAHELGRDDLGDLRTQRMAAP